MSENYQHELFMQKLYGKNAPIKKVYRIPKKSAKRIAAEKIEKESRGGDDTELQKWFKARIVLMKGECCRCGEKIARTPYNLAICSVAHILNRNDFDSVRTHPLNWLELGASCGCHNWFDKFASWEEIAQDKIWTKLLERFIMVEPSLSPEDRKKLPEVLQQEIKMPF